MDYPRSDVRPSMGDPRNSSQVENIDSCLLLVSTSAGMEIQSGSNDKRLTLQYENGWLLQKLHLV